MPYFNRLLILAILALSVSVQSAPIGGEPSYDIVPTDSDESLVPVARADQGSLASAPGANECDEEEVDLEGREFDDDSAETRDFDEKNEVHSSNVERRAGKTTKAAPQPKPTKAPKPKTTKAPKPKTTKAKTTKTKATAKPTKAVKTATTAKPTKTAKVTKTKASKTTKATGTAKPSACPVKKPTAKPRGFIGRAYDYVAHLLERDNEEFIGWHGTNSDTAALWASKGYLIKPTKPDGFLDFLGIGAKAAAGTSGADAQLGPGLYVSDNKDTSIVAANINVLNNKGTTPALCAIFARSSGNWRNVIRKAIIPNNLVGDSSDKTRAVALENDRLDYVKKAIPGVTPEGVVKVAFYSHDRPDQIGQLAIPESIEDQFFAKCFKVEQDVVVASDLAASNQGTRSFPEFSYMNNQALQHQWNIVTALPESAGGCS